MTDTTDTQSSTSNPAIDILKQALAMETVEGGLSAMMLEAYSNAPNQLPPEKGFPFGGLLAAMCAHAMKAGLAIDAPLQTLSIQYLAAAHYGTPLVFCPRMLREGRQISYASLEAAQGDRLTHSASGTFGGLSKTTTTLTDARAVPPSLDSLPAGPGIEGPTAPRFANQVEYRFDGGPNIFGGRRGGPHYERTWMRMRDGEPMDMERLCFLLDALYPPTWTGVDVPPMMTTVDLRYDFITPATPENTPDGWAFFEYRLIEHSNGWAVDEATAWGADGSVLATSRQRRKVLGRS